MPGFRWSLSDRIVQGINEVAPRCVECRMASFHLPICSRATKAQKRQLARGAELRRLRTVTR